MFKDASFFFRLSSTCVTTQPVTMRWSLSTRSASSRIGGSATWRPAAATTDTTRTASSHSVSACGPVWGRGWRRWRCTSLCPGWVSSPSNVVQEPKVKSSNMTKKSSKSFDALTLNLVNWLWSCSWCSTMRSSWKMKLRSWSRKLEPCSSLGSQSTCASCPEPEEGAAEGQHNTSSLPLHQSQPSRVLFF